jgi:hypothetical protein
MSREILCSCWQCSSKLLAVPVTSSFCFGQFVLKFLFVCNLPVFVSYSYRAALLAASERFPAVNFFWTVNAFRAKGSPGYEKLRLGFRHGRKFGTADTKFSFIFKTLQTE